MNILILHHVEEMWASTMEQYFSVDYDLYLTMVVEHIQESDYDDIMLNMFEDWQFEESHHNSGLSGYVGKINTYAYGWERTMFQDWKGDHEPYCAGGNHSQVVELQPWMWDLKGHNVSIAGAFDGECIEDLEVALNHLEIPFNRIEDLIV